jgi:hypothetical protein
VAKSVHSLGAKRQLCTLLNTTAKAVLLPRGTLMGILYSGIIEDASKRPSSDEKSLEEKLKDIESLQLGANLSNVQRTELMGILLLHHNAFQWDPDTIGRTTLVEHKIDTGSARPVVQRQYPIPSVARESLMKQVRDMQRKGFIRESCSPWRSPILLIKKVGENGEVSYRFCIDLRKVNEVALKDAYSLPRIEETVDALSGAKFFSTMDVDRAFWQVGLREEDKCKTAFVIDGQLFEFNVMPFGSSNAPATFQRLMDKVLRGLTWYQCLVYIDDVLVFGKSFEAHLVNLGLVLSRVQAAGLKLKPAKCKFGDNRVDYLGFSISDKGRLPARKKVEALLKVSPPSTNKALLSFLLSINYYRNEIPRFGDLSVDLFELANSKKRICIWTDKLLNNFKELQTALANSPILAFPNFDMPFIIQGDSSKKATGGATLQGDHVEWSKITRVNPVCFFGRKLTPTEQRWDVMCRELLALVHGYESSEHLVYGRRVVFLTDHEPLVTLKNLKNPMGRIGRLLLRLQGVDYEIKYIKGSKNHIADFMSRVDYPGDPVPTSINQIEMNFKMDWVKEQVQDEELNAVRKRLRSGNMVETEWLSLKNGSAWWRVRPDLYMVEDILRYGSGQVVVPFSLYKVIFGWHHNSALAGHRGFETTLTVLKFRYFWHGMSTFVKEQCRICEKCQLFNYANAFGKAPMISIESHRRNETLQVDFMGPFRKTRNGNQYIVLQRRNGNQ